MFKPKFVHTVCTFKPKFVHTVCTFKAYLQYFPVHSNFSLSKNLYLRNCISNILESGSSFSKTFRVVTRFFSSKRPATSLNLRDILCNQKFWTSLVISFMVPILN